MAARYRESAPMPPFDPGCRTAREQGIAPRAAGYSPASLAQMPGSHASQSPCTMADSLVMATREQCEEALRGLAKRLDGVDGSLKKRRAPDRTVSCHVPDLGTTFSGRLSGGLLLDIAEKPMDNPQIRLTVCSDDLLAVMAGELPFSTAWASGRLKVEASMLDMIRLRSVL
jgi:hypothetical protein